MNFTYTFTLSRIQTYWLMLQLLHKTHFTLVVPLLCVFIALVFTLHLILNGYDPLKAIYCAIPIPLVGVLMVLLIPLVTALGPRKHNPFFWAEKTYELNDEGLRVHGENHDGILNWDGLFKVVESKGYFFFFVSNNMAHFLPKFIIENETELNSLREFIKEKYPNAKLSKF